MFANELSRRNEGFESEQSLASRAQLCPVAKECETSKDGVLSKRAKQIEQGQAG